MSSPLDDGRQGRGGWVRRHVAQSAGAVRVDLARLHAAWMGILFAGDLESDHSVVERSRPRTTRGRVGYQLWAVLGGAALVVGYPCFVLGLATRYYSRRLDRVSASLGLAGIVGVSLLAWGLLTAATYLSPIAFEGLVAVATAGIVATVSAVIARYVTRRTGRVGTVALGYPFGMTAVFLPPVVASLYSPTLASFVFPRSTSIAIWLLDNVLAVGGFAAFIRATFELEGVAYVGMWFALAVPTGWLLGGLVTLADAVRPSGAPRTPEEIRT